MTEKVRVYRVTCAGGLGMYRPRKYSDSLWCRAGAADIPAQNQPLPHSDGVQFASGRDFFAFKDKQQMSKWIGKEVAEKLAEFGGQVRVFEVDPKHVFHGKSQVAFTKRKAKLVAKIPLKEFIGGNVC